MDRMYPKGMHPLRDLYDLKQTQAIGKTVGLKTEPELNVLRDNLAILAENALGFLKGLDVSRSRSQRRKALENEILGPARRLLRRLKRTEPLTYELEEPHFELAPIRAELLDLVERVESISVSLKGKDPRGARPLTDYKQFVVHLMTKLYVSLFPERPLTRSSDGKEITSEYVRFIRASVEPLIRIALNQHKGDIRRHLNLNRQIQIEKGRFQKRAESKAP